MTYEQQRERIFRLVHDFEGKKFEALALEIFRFQARYNPVYARFLSLLSVDVQKVKSNTAIPFLPIQFFKNYAVKTGEWKEETVFTSSGTTGMATSRHFLRDLNFYKRNALQGFSHFYGSPEKYCILTLLPSYLEREGSSLIIMTEDFIRRSAHPSSGFFLNNKEELVKVLKKQVAKREPTLLLGVSFALLDLAEQFPLDLGGVTVMETGGMKGRRREITRAELHGILKNAFQLEHIHSEYGMTELFSQAYSKSEGLFHPSFTMRVLAREITDPLTMLPPGKTGVLNVIDLANFDTCSFIATEDLGRVEEDGSFEVLGRLDNSDIRGCNLMV
jgi:phenylacetate-coenzyme A ligase PaaK-like adenylate-forming protein